MTKVMEMEERAHKQNSQGPPVSESKLILCTGSHTHARDRQIAWPDTHTKVLESLYNGASCTACSSSPVVHKSSAVCSSGCAVVWLQIGRECQVRGHAKAKHLLHS